MFFSLIERKHVVWQTVVVVGAKHRQTAMVSSAAMIILIMEEGKGPHILGVEEQGKEFRQNVAVMWDTL